MWIAYADAAATLLPGDADGDGVCDGLEYFFQTDPHNPASHPHLGISNSPGNLALSGDLGSEFFIPTDHRLFVRHEERQHLQCWMLIANEPHPMPAGFQVRLTPSADLAVALPGGPPAPGALLVPVARDGTIPFDVLFRPGHAAHPRLEESVDFTDPASNRKYTSMKIKQIWEDPPLDLTVDWAHRKPGAPGAVRHSWPTVPDTAEAVVLEAARDDDRFGVVSHHHLHRDRPVLRFAPSCRRLGTRQHATAQISHRARSLYTTERARRRQPVIRRISAGLFFSYPRRAIELRVHRTEAGQFVDRSGTVFHPQVHVAVVIATGTTFGAHDKQRRTLLSVTIATGGLTGLQGGEKPIGKFGALLFCAAS